MEEYPSVLPDPLWDSYKITPISNIVRSTMESGRIRQRRSDTSTHFNFSLTWRFTRQQYAIFASWHKHKINDGTDQFYITIDGLNGRARHIVQMQGGIYQPTFNNGFWDVSTTLECFNPTPMTEADLDSELS